MRAFVTACNLFLNLLVENILKYFFYLKMIEIEIYFMSLMYMAAKNLVSLLSRQSSCLIESLTLYVGY